MISTRWLTPYYPIFRTQWRNTSFFEPMSLLPIYQKTTKYVFFWAYVPTGYNIKKLQNTSFLEYKCFREAIQMVRTTWGCNFIDKLHNCTTNILAPATLLYSRTSCFLYYQTRVYPKMHSFRIPIYLSVNKIKSIKAFLILNQMGNGGWQLHFFEMLLTHPFDFGQRKWPVYLL